VRRGLFDERPWLRCRIAQLETELAALQAEAAVLRPYDRDEAHPAPGDPAPELPTGVRGFAVGRYAPEAGR
jgi:hypothetical protein